ncbi:E3 ubiquitin-protein ligase SINA-like 10 [Ananas comosus]|uniref:RING-type E3 ubiquitin transferase n=1 Tax=Ananas comosus TaxID=4615 RepID=A0A199VL96_ANACO|nr:E3 ubiquitin-protein ligase SINA-like 10 [Ananas comosus]
MAKLSSAEGERPTTRSLTRKRKACGGGGGGCGGGSSSPAAAAAEGERGVEGGVGEDEEEEEEDRGEEKGEAIRVMIDPDVLDCSICFEPLRPPLYQCQKGHAACSSCWSLRNNKCHICLRRVTLSRIFSLEKLVESIAVSCSYAKWGCPESVNYAEKAAHEETCIFGPSKCPFPRCTYEGYIGLSPTHFSANHNKTPKGFSYNQSFKINVLRGEPFTLLIAWNDYVGKHVFLLANKNLGSLGCALSLTCLHSGVLNCHFSYDIMANDGSGASLQFKDNVVVVREWNELEKADISLVVPKYFRNSDGEFELDLCIHKIWSSAVKKK